MSPSHPSTHTSPSEPTPSSVAPRTLTQALAEALARHTDHTFGLMGNGNAHLIDHLGNLGIAYTAVRHESGTVAAADAYTRVTGKLAIATTTYGAGFTNALTPLAEATQARTPILVVVGDEPTGGRRPWDVDQELLSAAIGVRSYRLSISEVDRTVDRAVAHMLRARKPVVLCIPYDLVDEPILEVPAPAVAPTTLELDDPALLASLSAAVVGEVSGELEVDTGPRSRQIPTTPNTTPAPHQLEAAAEALANAERPIVLAGVGAWHSGASGELDQAAAQLGAFTASTALAQGIFSDEHFDLGVAGGFGQEHAMTVIAQADVLLVVGASLNQFTMRFGDLVAEDAVIVRIDIDQVSAPHTNNTSTQLLLHGDARESLQKLLGYLAGKSVASKTWRDQFAAELVPGGKLRVRELGFEEHPAGVCPDGLLDPRAVAARIGELLPTDRHVTSDGGHFIGWANMYWPVVSPERMIMVGTAYQTIGLGFATVAGVAAAAPETTVVLSTGDGGGLMALADLETAIRTAESCVIVVWNDSAYGAEVHLYGAMGLDQAPMLIPDTDFAGIAAALGATGVRVDTLDDLEALAQWREAGAAGTILLDCRISRSVVAPHQLEIQHVNGVRAQS